MQDVSHEEKAVGEQVETRYDVASRREEERAQLATRDLPYVSPESAPEKVREVLKDLPPLNIFRMVANSETVFRPFLGLGSALLASKTFDHCLRELVILLVGKLSDGTYEWVQHVPIAKSCGATDEQITALEKADLDADCFDAAEKAVLNFSADALQNVKASDATFKEVEKHLSPAQIVELIMILGFYRTVAVLTESTDIDIDGPIGTAVVDALR